MAVVSDTAIAQAAISAGFPANEIATAVAVALAESSGDATATNSNPNGSTDYGLWQINSIHKADLAGGNWQIPGDNARMAYAVWSRAGRHWTPWMAYNAGRHLPYLTRGTAAAGGDASYSVQEAGNPLSGASELMGEATKVITTISDKDLWIRAGMFLTGTTLLVAAIVGISWTLNSKKAMQMVSAVVGGTTKTAKKAATGIASAAKPATGDGE